MQAIVSDLERVAVPGGLRLSRFVLGEYRSDQPDRHWTTLEPEDRETFANYVRMEMYRPVPESEDGRWIEAIVPLESVDWRETVRNRLHYPYEREVTLVPEARVQRTAQSPISGPIHAWRRRVSADQSEPSRV